MAGDWFELTRLTQGRPLVVERVRLADSDIAIEGDFAPPPLAVLSAEDQTFVAAFVRCHGSIKEMEQLPELIFVIDVRQEDIAIREASSLGIPVIAIVDTNCDPRRIDYLIPANDDAIRSIGLITSTIADAVIEGQQIRASLQAEEEGWEPEEGEEDVQYLGEATLAKLRSGELEFGE